MSVAAVYTSSQVTSYILAFLAQNQPYITELRKEIVEGTNKDGTINISKLYKLEACIQETLRISPPQTSILPTYYPISILLILPIDAPQRRALKNVILKDGIVIPKGALIGFPCIPAGMDPSIYPEPEKFMPFCKENLSSPVTIPTKS